MAHTASYRASYILALLTLVNVTSECFRYLLGYLSAVSVAECKAVCEGVPFVPLCRANAGDCAACRRLHRAEQYSVLDGACITTAQYGILAGPAFALLYAVFGLFAGRLADTSKRHAVHTVAIVAWSCATLGLGASHSWWQVLVARLSLGVAESLQAPCSSSLIAQLFPPSRRARANSVYSLGVYVGGGAASLIILLAQRVGWRRACWAYGGVGVGMGVVYGCTGRVRRDKEEQGSSSGTTSPLPAGDPAVCDSAVSSSAPSSSPSAPPPWLASLRLILGDGRVRVLLLASSARFYAGLSLGAYLPVYMGRAFPEHAATYSLASAAIVSLGGAASAYGGGHLADRWGKHDPRAAALVPAAGSLLAIGPLVGVVVSGRLSWALAWLALEYLLAECWLGPALALLQASLPSEAQGLGVAVLLLCCTGLGELGPLLVGASDPGDARGLGRLLGSHVAASYLLAGLAFLWLARTLTNHRPASQQAATQQAAVQVEAGLTSCSLLLLEQPVRPDGSSGPEEDEEEAVLPLGNQSPKR